ncbi:MAG TPA: hypothetical protein VFV50_04950, partial [Bdellovibrionales bacterium]|nr:hypothetical protein [Bdellovibrionales bacterium]
GACAPGEQPTLEGGGNGDGYPGGDELLGLFSGTYDFSLPGLTCSTTTGRIETHRYQIEINKAGAAQSRGTLCSTQSKFPKIPTRNLEFAPYNMDLVAHGPKIYVRKGASLDEDTVLRFPETLCRSLAKNGTGVDVVILTDKKSENHRARVYKGIVGAAGFESVRTEDFAVERTVVAEGVYHYAGNGLELTLDTNASFEGTLRHTGTVSSLPEGFEAPDSLACRSHTTQRYRTFAE